MDDQHDRNRTIHVRSELVDDRLATILEAGPNWNKVIPGKGLTPDQTRTLVEGYFPGLFSHAEQTR
jgi:hypothetical protein